jgi:hypothetical protein
LGKDYRWGCDYSMAETPRPGFESSRKISLHQASGDGLVLDATPAERLAMVWPLTRDCWAFVGDADEPAKREFQRPIERVSQAGADYLLVGAYAMASGLIH